MPTELYLITAVNENKDSVDLLVEAGNEVEATGIWSTWVAATELGPVDGQPSVFQIPRKIGRNRAIAWFDTRTEDDEDPDYDDDGNLRAGVDH